MLINLRDMDSDSPTMQVDLSYLENLVTLGLLINAYYYFGLTGAVIVFILAVLLEPVSSADILGTSPEKD